MSKIIMTDNGQQYQTPGIGKTIGAVYVGSLASSAVATGLSSAVSIPCIKKMKNISQSSDTVEIRKAIDNVMQKTGLKSQGVEVIDVKTPTSRLSGSFAENIGKLLNGENTLEELHPENKKLATAMRNAIKQYKQNSFFGQVSKIQTEYFMQMFEQGGNACFLPKAKKGGNKVIVNIEKLGASAFHEIGHAINYNMSKFWKSMQKMRKPMMITSAALGLVALVKRKKAEGEEPNGVFDKATTFVKNNVGKLTLASFVPIVAEELMATYRGNKMAKKVLSPELFKKVQNTNRLGAITYIATAAGMALAGVVGSKVRDAIAHPKEIQN